MDRPVLGMRSINSWLWGYDHYKVNNDSVEQQKNLISVKSRDNTDRLNICVQHKGLCFLSKHIVK